MGHITEEDVLIIIPSGFMMKNNPSIYHSNLTYMIPDTDPVLLLWWK